VTATAEVVAALESIIDEVRQNVHEHPVGDWQNGFNAGTQDAADLFDSKLDRIVGLVRALEEAKPSGA
jgi:hypothetical protein